MLEIHKKTEFWKFECSDNMKCFGVILTVALCQLQLSCGTDDVAPEVSSADTVISHKKESKLTALYKKVINPSYDCPPDSKHSKGPQIFINVDCEDEGARWDYSYQVSCQRYKGYSHSPVTLE